MPRDLVPSPTLRDLLRARDLLHARAIEGVTVPELAAAAGLSPDHFARAFERAFGATPHRYLTRLRLEHAKALLARPGTTVTEACFATGFSSLGSWSALFSRTYGRSPSAYHREMVRMAQVPDWLARPRIPLCFFGGHGIAVSEKRAAPGR